MITRHNYEEFFILYMDNELSSEDRRMVEAFVNLHPDLKEELDLLLQYKLEPDTTITYSGKEELLRVEHDQAPSFENYQEWLSLYIDNELSIEQKKNIELLIAGHPSIQKELRLLQRTKLQPEEIVFVDKASLYRKEEKQRPVFSLWRIAAALLLLIGIGIATAVVINHNKSGSEQPTIVKGNKPVTEPAEQGPANNDKSIDAPVNGELVADNTPTKNNTVISPEIITSSKKENRQEKNVAVNPRINNRIDNDVQQVKKEPVVANNNKPNNDLPQSLNNDGVNKNIAGNNPDNNVVNNITVQQPQPLKPDVAVTNNNTRPSDIQTASYNDVATLDQPDEKKAKNRGLFRKIARTFEKRTNIDPTDDNRLLVAGLSLRLK